MARGVVLSLRADNVVERALEQVTAVPVPPAGAPPDAGGRPIHYRLEPPNGGTDPTARYCHSWAHGNRTPVGDCVALALHCAGVDRKQPTYSGTAGEWLHCPSILTDADGPRKFFAPVRDEQARPGDLLVNDRHVGVIVGTPTLRSHLRGTLRMRALSWAVDGVIVNLPARSWDLAALASKHPLLTVDLSTRYNTSGLGLGVGLGGPWGTSCRVVRARNVGAGVDRYALAAAVAAAIGAATLIYSGGAHA